jgi:hypothetical protein
LPILSIENLIFGTIVKDKIIVVNKVKSNIKSRKYFKEAEKGLAMTLL